MINNSGYHFQIVHCVIGSLRIQLALMLIWIFSSWVITSVYTLLKKMSLPQTKNFLHTWKQAFRLLTLLCKCDNAHIGGE